MSCLGLLVGSVFFVNYITLEYLRKASTTISYTVPASRFKPLTLVICFNPYNKKSMLTKFNLTCFKLKNMSISYPDFYNQANYKLGDDFYISLGNLDQKKAIIDSVDFENDIVDVEELYTLSSKIASKSINNRKLPPMMKIQYLFFLMRISKLKICQKFTLPINQVHFYIETQQI